MTGAVTGAATGPMDRDRRRRGVALVVVLWGLVLISIIAGGFAAGKRTDTTMAFNVAENAKARALAEAGVQRGILEALNKADGGWPADGGAYPVSAPGGEIEVSLQDELGKIDLNTAPDELMRALFISLDVEDDGAAALADAITDFRDQDDLVRVNGAEARAYRAEGLAHEPKNARFEAVEELRLVLGMTEALYRRAAPLVTVHSRRPWVNLDTAPFDVLVALPGLDDAMRERIMESRGAGGDDDEAETVTAPPPAARRAALLPTRFGRSLPTGTVLTVRAEARTASGGLFVREALVRLIGEPNDPYRYLDWRQGTRRPPEQDESTGPSASDR